MPIASFSMPGLVERKMLDLWNSLPSTNSGDIDALGDAFEQSTRNTGIPAVMGAGMVMNPKNARKLAKILAPMMEYKGFSDVDRALIYLKNKYPKLANIPKFFSFEEFDTPNIIGAYDPNTKGVQLSSKVKGAMPNVNTVAHEIIHALQDKRGKLPNANSFIDASNDLAGYQNQAHEIGARRGADTAVTTYLKYLLNKK